jgi:hypothetical protein
MEMSAGEQTNECVSVLECGSRTDRMMRSLLDLDVSGAGLCDAINTTNFYLISTEMGNEKELVLFGGEK